MTALNLTDVQLEILWSIIESESKTASGPEKKIIENILKKIKATDHVAAIRQRWDAEVQ